MKAFEKLVRCFIKNILTAKPFELETYDYSDKSFLSDDLGMDSLLLLNFFAQLEVLLGEDFAEEILARLLTLGSVIDYIVKGNIPDLVYEENTSRIKGLPYFREVLVLKQASIGATAV
jgi:acyl carrier protein